MSNDPPDAIAGILPIGGISPVLPIAAVPGFALAPAGDLGAPFRLDQLPTAVQQAFKKPGSDAWRAAVREAINAGVVDPRVLADLMFFMQHLERMSAGVGKLIDKKEDDFVKLRAEWLLYFTIVTKILKPSITPTVFVPANSSRNYDDFVAKPTTGRVTLMVNGRKSDGSGRTDPKTSQWIGGFQDEFKTFDRMEEVVESLGDGDVLYVSNWQFQPDNLLLTADPSGSKSRTWGHLIADKAGQGVRIRVIVAQHPIGSPFMTDLNALGAVVDLVPTAKRDNFKFIVSPHPHFLGVHHRKYVVARKGKITVAFCGGLDVSFNRAPQQVPAGGSRWSAGFVWHDVAAKLEGLIARDFEHEFVEAWNREKDKALNTLRGDWKPFEKLTQSQSGGDSAAAINKQDVQVLRTVSVGPAPADIRRDDIWRAYFQVIGRARRFLYLENQYLQQPKLADAIVKQAEAEPGLIVLVLIGTGSDDVDQVDPSLTGLKRAAQEALVEATKNAFALRLEFFKRLTVAPLTANRLRVYTLNYPHGITHTKLILADDEVLSVGSANGNPRGFFFDSEVNFVLDHAETVGEFRSRLWAHNLGVAPDKVAKWSVPQFFAQWNSVAKANLALLGTPEKMVGEGVIPFEPTNPKDPRFKKGLRGPIHVPFVGAVDVGESLF
jgi:phosphatidylserine/phosphatidylglycerophosphate/cardiolipin synthase-like enzyme